MQVTVAILVSSAYCWSSLAHFQHQQPQTFSQMNFCFPSYNAKNQAVYAQTFFFQINPNSSNFFSDYFIAIQATKVNVMKVLS